MLQAVGEIYDNRSFVVADGGKESDPRPQRAGISQGCPLSPFLFGMVMTVLMHDARSMLSNAASHACTKGELEEVLFADDTLLITWKSKWQQLRNVVPITACSYIGERST